MSNIGTCNQITDKYTLIGQDKGQALAAQDNFAGEGTVCYNPDNKSYYYLEGAPQNAPVSSSSNNGTAGLKHDIDKLRSDISSLQLEIQRDQKMLEELDGKDEHHGVLSNFIHHPFVSLVSGIAGLTALFGVAVPFMENLWELSQLNDAELLRRTNERLKELGAGCAPLTSLPTNTSSGAGKWAVAALGVGALALTAYDSYSQTNGGNAAGPTAPALPPIDYSNMDEASLHGLYDRLNQQYSDLVNQKVQLEAQIQAKAGQGPQKESAWAKMADNWVVKGVAAAGIFGWTTKSWTKFYKGTRLGNYLQDKIAAREKAFNDAAESIALQTIAGGQCQAETATATEPVASTAPEGLPVKATVTQTDDTTNMNMSMLDDGESSICEMEPAILDGQPVDVLAYPQLSGGTWYTYNDGVSTQIVDAATYQQLTTPPPVDVPEADLKAFTESDYQPYLQYVDYQAGAKVSNLPLAHLPQELAFLYQEDTSASNKTDQLDELESQFPNLMAAAYGNVASPDAIKADAIELWKIYAPVNGTSDEDSFEWALQQYAHGLEAGIRPDVSNLVKLAGEDGIVRRYFRIQDSQRSWQDYLNHSACKNEWNCTEAEMASAPKWTFNQAAQKFADWKPSEVHVMSDHEAWEKAMEPVDRKIDAFNEANAATAWKITLMTVTGQAVEAAPVTAPAAASAPGWGGGQLAGHGI